jgi:hypothetical protein
MKISEGNFQYLHNESGNKNIADCFDYIRSYLNIIGNIYSSIERSKIVAYQESFNRQNVR